EVAAQPAPVDAAVRLAPAEPEQAEELLVGHLPRGRELEPRQRKVGAVEVDRHDRGGVGQPQVAQDVAAGRGDRADPAGRLELERGQVDLGVLADPGVDQPPEGGGEGALQQPARAERRVPVDGPAQEAPVGHRSPRAGASVLSARTQTKAASAAWNRSGTGKGLRQECSRAIACEGKSNLVPRGRRFHGSASSRSGSAPEIAPSVAREPQPPSRPSAAMPSAVSPASARQASASTAAGSSPPLSWWRIASRAAWAPTPSSTAAARPGSHRPISAPTPA